MEDGYSIVINKLSKTYAGSAHMALDNLSISVKVGEVYGFLGSNGAGKSTTIRLLLNFLQPTSGSATINGLDIVEDSVKIKRQVGYLSGDVMLYQKMTGRQHVDYLNQLMPSATVDKSVEIAKRLNADIDKPVGELSKGNKQKIGIILALMNEPSVLILDEPTSGLDPLVQSEFYSLITEAKQNGATVFVSSHNLSEVQRMCDRVGIIRDGKLVSEQSITELKFEASQTFTVTFRGKVPLKTLRTVPGVHNENKISDNAVEVHVHGDIAPFLKFLASHDVARLASHELDLEDEFKRFYEVIGATK